MLNALLRNRPNAKNKAMMLRLAADPSMRALRREFLAEREIAAYQTVYDMAAPLVTVCTATYNRSTLLLERSVKSVLAQTYANLELIVVGDHCTDDTPELMASITDPRVRFINLARRGEYPSEPNKRWMVAGTKPINHALDLAAGDFITHLDDDDEFPAERIAKLVDMMRSTRSDILWHPFDCEMPDGSWTKREAPEFTSGQVSTSSVFYHRWFTRILWDPRAYVYEEPGDWNRFRKFVYLGTKRARHPDSLLRHYKERAQAAS